MYWSKWNYYSKKGGAPVNADAIKTSAGAMFKIPICKVDHIKDAVYHLQASEIKVIAATEKAIKWYMIMI